VILAAGTYHINDVLDYKRVSAIDWGTIFIAVDHHLHPYVCETGTQPAHLAPAHTQELGGNGGIKRASIQTDQDIYSMLLLLVQSQCPHVP
jgi:hypothetical protein